MFQKFELVSFKNFNILLLFNHVQEIRNKGIAVIKTKYVLGNEIYLSEYASNSRSRFL